MGRIPWQRDTCPLTTGSSPERREYNKRRNFREEEEEEEANQNPHDAVAAYKRLAPIMYTAQTVNIIDPSMSWYQHRT